MTSSLINKPQFPGAWLQPQKPAYGTFPYPFKGLGSEQDDSASSLSALKVALRLGYRHIDTAFTYSNQHQIGTACKELGIEREELFVTSKLHPYNNSYREAWKKIREANLLIWGKDASPGDNYLDSFLIHYPGFGDLIGTWGAFQEAKIKGLVRHIGVSNYEPWHLEKMKAKTGDYPEVNQIEFHPWIYDEQVQVLDFCQSRGIALEGYSPLAQGKRIKDPFIDKLAFKYQTTPSRILIRWCMQHKVLPIVGSRNPIHISSNAEPYTFKLSTQEIETIDGLGASDPVRIAEQWQWNSKKAPFGGPIPHPSSFQRVRTFISKTVKNVFF